MRCLQQLIQLHHELLEHLVPLPQFQGKFFHKTYPVFFNFGLKLEELENFWSSVVSASPFHVVLVIVGDPSHCNKCSQLQ